MTAHVLDLLGTDLAAKLVQQELDRVALDDAAPGIDARLELRARQHRARPFHQRVQQRVFPRAQLDGFPLAHDAAQGRIQQQCRGLEVGLDPADMTARQGANARLELEQLERLDQDVIGTLIDVPPVVTALARSMEKLHRERDIAIDVDVPAHARFRGEQQDLEEMIGNLVDNACKWAQSRVAIEVVADRPASDSAKNDASDGGEKSRVRIIVDDDGPGLSPAEREQVALRGARLDETKPGSGLGLSIVVELAGLYGGVLTLGTAPIGGLRTELALPGG